MTVQRRLNNGTIVNFEEPGPKIKFTKEQVVEAINLGGYPQSTGALLRDDEKGNIDSACALGMGMLNLGVSPTSFWKTLKSLDDNISLGELVDANDLQKKSYKQIARLAKKLWKDSLSEEVGFDSYSFGEFNNYQGRKVKSK